MAHFEKLDKKHPYYAIAAIRMSQKPEEKEVTVARFYWKFAAFNFINKRWREILKRSALTDSFVDVVYKHSRNIRLFRANHASFFYNHHFVTVYAQYRDLLVFPLPDLPVFLFSSSFLSRDVRIHFFHFRNILLTFEIAFYLWSVIVQW